MKNLEQQMRDFLSYLQKNRLCQSDDFFVAQAYRLFTGLLMYVADTPDEWRQLNIDDFKQHRKQPFLANEEAFLRYVESRKLRYPLTGC
ncbi:hypothetical protein AGMMS50289_17200 [Betaproteobacteria bacterium]|nr:hypothetical protein AGMMS50289_17200 [Betaproteobacteria bacterium]